MNKMKYDTPVMEIVQFEVEDIITESDGLKQITTEDPKKILLFPEIDI